jgi:beta-N-acetylhexosaminidase
LPAAWRQRVSIGVQLVGLCIAIALLPFAIDWRSPMLASYRPAALLVLIAVPLVLMSIAAWFLRTSRWSVIRGAPSVAMLLAASAVLITTLSLETQFHRVRARVLAADPAQLARLGRHLIVGYRDATEIDRLLERRAIAGVFVGSRNVEGLSADAIHRQIVSWQEVRRRQGLPPLLIATDQEGGAISRVSPPLPRQPSIASVVAPLAEEGARKAAARDYGLTQGRALARLGINLNFAPVVDLDKNLVNPNDRYTRIRERAISADPMIVTAVARQYCLGLREAGVRCTLKHFPGLGSVYEDTHLEAGHLRIPLDQLERGDWTPFRSLMDDGAFTMLSHARLTALDPERPVSFSRAVVSGLLRQAWRHDGVLITDDFSMAAAYGDKEGIAAAGTAALNAGVDLILIAYDPAQYFVVMDGLLAADRDGLLSATTLARSAQRLEKVEAGR